MNEVQQPKFKFGDKVRDVKTNAIFTVFAIGSPSPGEFSYRDEFYKSLFTQESDLELYQEPQKKKLYAYDTPAGVSHHFNSEEAGEKFKRVNCGEWNRVPGYDIEYPRQDGSV